MEERVTFEIRYDPGEEHAVDEGRRRVEGLGVELGSANEECPGGGVSRGDSVGEGGVGRGVCCVATAVSKHYER